MSLQKIKIFIIGPRHCFILHPDNSWKKDETNRIFGDLDRSAKIWHSEIAVSIFDHISPRSMRVCAVFFSFSSNLLGYCMRRWLILL